MYLVEVRVLFSSKDLNLYRMKFVAWIYEKLMCGSNDVLAL